MRDNGGNKALYNLWKIGNRVHRDGYRISSYPQRLKMSRAALMNVGEMLHLSLAVSGKA